jgi:hypothetical protein
MMCCWIACRCTFTKEVDSTDWFHCMAHRLHLSVSAALGAEEKVKSTTNRIARKLKKAATDQNTVFTRSPKQVDALLAIQVSALCSVQLQLF